MRLQGKVAIVTGGGSGFGEGIAKRFAEEGAKLVVNDIDDRGGERVAGEIERAQGQGSALYLRGDVARPGHGGARQARAGALRPPRHHGQQCRHDA
jgi:3-oxoacyl-[acyl-carrier protein] reductase